MKRNLEQLLFEYPKTLKYVSQVFVVSIAILAIILSVNASVISQYENSAQREYNWLYPWDILRFPVDQIAYNYAPKRIALDLKNYHKGGIHFVFLLDRTASVSRNPEIIGRRNTETDFVQSLYKNVGEEYRQKLDSIEYQSLMCLYMIQCLLDEKSDRETNLRFTVAYNDGLEDRINFIHNQRSILATSATSIHPFIEDFYTSRKKMETGGDVSYFDLVFQYINKEIQRDTTERKIVTIMSDFGHDQSPEHSLNDVHLALGKYPQNIQMNLVRYPLSKSGSAQYKPEKLVDIISDNFTDTYTYQLDIQSFESQLNRFQKLDRLKEFVTPTYQSEKDIYMVYPDVNINDGRNMYSGVELNLDDYEGHPEYLISYSHEGDNTTVMEYSVKSSGLRGKLKVGDQGSIKLTGDEPLKLRMDINGQLSDLASPFLDIYSSQENKKTRFNITFVEKASITTAQLHYLSASVAMLSLLGFVFLMVMGYLKSEMNRRRLLILLFGSFLLFCLMTFWGMPQEQVLFVLLCLLVYAVILYFGIVVRSIELERGESRRAGVKKSIVN